MDDGLILDRADDPDPVRFKFVLMRVVVVVVVKLLSLIELILL